MTGAAAAPNWRGALPTTSGLVEIDEALRLMHLSPELKPIGRILGVDHGVTFAVEPKLRTVLWAWRSKAFTEEEQFVISRGVQGLAANGELRAQLSPLLDGEEIDELAARLSDLAATGCFPEPSPDWPPLPWPLV